MFVSVLIVNEGEGQSTEREKLGKERLLLRLVSERGSAGTREGGREGGREGCAESNIYVLSVILKIVVRRKKRKPSKGIESEKQN